MTLPEPAFGILPCPVVEGQLIPRMTSVRSVAAPPSLRTRGCGACARLEPAVARANAQRRGEGATQESVTYGGSGHQGTRRRAGRTYGRAGVWPGGLSQGGV